MQIIANNCICFILAHWYYDIEFSCSHNQEVGITIKWKAVMNLTEKLQNIGKDDSDNILVFFIS